MHQNNNALHTQELLLKHNPRDRASEFTLNVVTKWLVMSLLVPVPVHCLAFAEMIY